MKNTILFVIAATMAITLSASANALWREKLTASDGTGGDRFGSSVSINGNICIVGAQADDGGAEYSGSAYIFRFDGRQWIQEDKLLASDAAFNDAFGATVSISDEVCIVGARGNDDSGNCSGSAYIFRFNGVQWVQEEKLVAPDAGALDFFGNSVSIDRNVCIVGSDWDDVYGMNSGSAYIFRFDETTNDWIFEAKLVPSDGAMMDHFGQSVSIDGNVAIIGAPMDEDNGSASGSVYIFDFNGVHWNQKQKLTASDAGPEEFFGFSVSIDANICVVGVLGDNGSAYVFQMEDANWVQIKKLTASDGNDADNFGSSVSVSRDTIVVGSVADDDNGTESGSAYIFQFQQSQWVKTGKILAFDGEAFDQFGESVSIDNGNIIVGAHGNDSLKGAAYTFRPCPAADLTGDCFVNFADFALIAQYWLVGENLD